MNAQCTMIGFARRAGKLVLGYDAVLRQMQAGAIQSVFLAADLSTKTGENICFACAQKHCRAVRCDFTMEEAAALIHRKAGVFAITDRHMEERLASLAQSRETEENA